MRTRIRRLVFAFAPALALLLFATPPLHVGRAQTTSEKSFRPDTPRALSSRQPLTDAPARAGAYLPQHGGKRDATLARARTITEGARRRAPARPAPVPRTLDKTARTQALARTAAGAVAPGTPLSRVLHVSQLSLVSSAGTDEEFVDRGGDLIADERTTFDAAGGSYDGPSAAPARATKSSPRLTTAARPRPPTTSRPASSSLPSTPTATSGATRPRPSTWGATSACPRRSRSSPAPRAPGASSSSSPPAASSTARTRTTPRTSPRPASSFWCATTRPAASTPRARARSYASATTASSTPTP